MPYFRGRFYEDDPTKTGAQPPEAANPGSSPNPAQAAPLPTASPAERKKELVRAECVELDSFLVDDFCCRMPEAYFSAHEADDLIRHLRLIQRIQAGERVEMEIRKLPDGRYQTIVVGINQSRSPAAITSAIVGAGFNMLDLQRWAYAMDNSSDPKTTYFVSLINVEPGDPTLSLPQMVGELRRQLRAAFQPQIAADTPKPAIPGNQTILALDNFFVLEEGAVLGGDFRLQRKLSAGGMGQVYLAQQLSLNRTVVVKFAADAHVSQDLRARFSREISTLATFNCPYIVQVYASGVERVSTQSTMQWMALEYMTGGDIERRLMEFGPPSREDVIRWLKQTLEGLQYAHKRGILHRDIKPQNLLLTEDADLKITDFGLLKESRNEDSSLTSAGAILGTPRYMAPEQALSEPVDERTDLFSVGSTFYHILTGKYAFDGESPTAILFRLTQEEAQPLGELDASIPIGLQVVVHRLMEKRRERRYQDSSVALEDLLSYHRRGLLT